MTSGKGSKKKRKEGDLRKGLSIRKKKRVRSCKRLQLAAATANHAKRESLGKRREMVHLFRGDDRDKGGWDEEEEENSSFLCQCLEMVGRGDQKGMETIHTFVASFFF